jgi:Flp pilus assembly protein CpaB
LLIIVLAAVLALAGTAAVFAYARQANERAIAGLTTEKVFAAKDAINPRTSLAQAQAQGLLTTETLPVSSVPAGALQSTAGLGNLVFSFPVQKAQLLLRPMLVHPTQNTAANVLPTPKGMVDVTVQMCVAESLVGYLTPGSDVNVYATAPTSLKFNVQRSCQTNHNAVPQGGAVTWLVLPRVLVLSVAPAQGTSSATSSVVADPPSSASSELSTGSVAVTFAVHPGTEADQLVQAADVYLPYLALIPPPTH